MIFISSKKNARASHFTFIVYPESAPEYWIQIIKNKHCPVIISPLHQFDYFDTLDECEAEAKLKHKYFKDDNIKLLYESYKNTSNADSQFSAADLLVFRNIDRLVNIRAGVQKKPHYHVVVDYGKNSNKTIQQCTDDFCIPCNATFPEIVTNIRGMVRYLIHLDDPEKFQYRVEDIRIMNDFFISDFLEYSSADEYNAPAEVFKFIFDRKIKNYFDLCLQTSAVPVWYKYVTTHTIHLRELFANIAYATDFDITIADEVKQYYDRQHSKLNNLDDFDIEFEL